MRQLLISLWFLGVVQSTPSYHPTFSKEDFIRASMSLAWPITVIVVELPKWFNDNVDVRFIERKEG
jgi:hypothetical protein